MPLFGYKECLCIYLHREHIIHPAGSRESSQGNSDILCSSQWQKCNCVTDLFIYWRYEKCGGFKAVEIRFNICERIRRLVVEAAPSTDFYVMICWWKLFKWTQKDKSSSQTDLHGSFDGCVSRCTHLHNRLFFPNFFKEGRYEKGMIHMIPFVDPTVFFPPIAIDKSA